MTLLLVEVNSVIRVILQFFYLLSCPILGLEPRYYYKNMQIYAAQVLTTLSYTHTLHVTRVYNSIKVFNFSFYHHFSSSIEIKCKNIKQYHEKYFPQHFTLFYHYFPTSIDVNFKNIDPSNEYFLDCHS